MFKCKTQQDFCYALKLLIWKSYVGAFIYHLFLHQRKRPCLGEEVDAVGDGVHGHRVSSDKETSKIHSGQVVELGIQTGQLPDVIADHVE